MTLFLTAIDKEGVFREFSYHFDSLEFILDALSLIGANGGQLLTAEVREDGTRIVLPIEAFDGQLFSKPIKALKRDWQQVLNEPVNFRSVHKQQRLVAIRNQIQRQTSYIGRLEGIIQVLEEKRQQVEATILREPVRSRLLNRLEESLQSYQRHLTAAQLRQQALSDKLSLTDK